MRREDVRVGIEKDGARVILALQAGTGTRATLELGCRGARPLAATLALAVSSEDDTESEFVLHNASLEIGEPKP